jgi:diguanylate cyclase (GGDEF)-like protein
MNSPLHRLLKRQYDACCERGSLDVEQFLAQVNQTYNDHDRDIKRSDRASVLMAEELEEMFAMRRTMLERSIRIEEVERANTAIAASEARIRHLAYHDALTGLPNRALLAERLAGVLDDVKRCGGHFSIHLIDLDKFKMVNDTFGHQAGDELLRHTAEELGVLCRDADTIARLGGDEFVVVHTRTTRAAAQALAERIVQRLAEPITLSVGQLYVGCSIGVAILEPTSLAPFDYLRQADLALYQAKEKGRGQFAFFEPEMDQAIAVRRSLQGDLRKALLTGQLELAYQPQVDSESRIVGIEALLRWNHPTRGVIPPGVFIPLAEECGAIVELGYFALRRAFEDSVRWPSLKVAINVSAHQLRMKDFYCRVESLVREKGIAPAQFELEITESLLLGDDRETHETLRKLSGLGFAIALDDFGTGYSSLSYLQRYPINKIKIDRSFVVNLGVDAEATAVISAIVTLAEALHLHIIAEGVETDVQRSELMAAGCSHVQGYLTGRPMSATAILGLLAPEHADRAVNAAAPLVGIGAHAR